MVRILSVLTALALAGCLGDPDSPACAELPPGASGCPAVDAGPDRGLDSDVDRGPDSDVDHGPDSDVDRGPDAAPTDAAPSDADPADRALGDGGPPDALPVGEACDGADDDGDGVVDEGTGGAPCIAGVGACESAGVELCTDAGDLVCDAERVAARVEACNGVDDDCDGQPDERLLFSSDEFEAGAMQRAERPAVAALGAHVLTVRRVAGERLEEGVLQPTDRLVLDLWDRRGGALEQFSVEDEAVTAYTVADFANGGDAGFVVLWGNRTGRAGTERFSIQALIAFPREDGFGDIDGPVELLQTTAAIDALDVAAAPDGIGAAWITEGGPFFGDLLFGDEPPVLGSVPLGGRQLPAHDIALGAAGERYFVAYTEGPAAARMRTLQLARMDGAGGVWRAPVAVAAGDRITGPTVAGRGQQVFVAWSELAGVDQVRFRPYDRELEPLTAAATVAGGPLAAVSPRLAVDAATVGLAWVELDDPDSLRSSVWFTRMYETRAIWDAEPPIRVSYGPARSGPVDLALGDVFAAVWFDGRRREPSAFARFGPFACAADAVDQ